MRLFQVAISFLSTETAMTGLHVAPTAPCSIEYESSSIDAESFHKQVGVVRAISKSGLLYLSCELECAIITPDPLLPKQMRYQTALRPDSMPRLYRDRAGCAFDGLRASSA